MKTRTPIMWALSAVLLAWVAAMAVLSSHRAACAKDGQLFNIAAWSCIPAEPPVILQRDLQRG